MASEQFKLAKEASLAANKSRLLQYEYDVQTFEAQKSDLEREVNLQNKINRETYNYQQEIRNLQRLSIMDQYDKSQDMYKQQLVWNEKAAKDAVASQQAVYEQRLAEIQQAEIDQEIAYERSLNTAGYNLDQAEFTLSEAIRTLDKSEADAERQKQRDLLSIGEERDSITRAKEEIKIRRASLANRERDARADANFETITAAIENIEARGLERAKGRKGKSSDATLQAATAAFAINTAKISDALFRSKESVKRERESLAADEKQLTGRSGRISKKVTLIDEARTAVQKDVKASKKLALQRSQLEAERLSKELDIDMEVFEMNQARLGESILNAAKARNLAIEEIATQKVKADFAADAARMLPVRMAPDPPRPYKAEMPTLVDPPEPLYTKPKAYMVPGPKKQSGLSKALMIGGAVIGIAGAAFTGGASLGLTMGMGTTAAAAATGIGLTAAGSLATIGSQYTY